MRAIELRSGLRCTGALVIEERSARTGRVLRRQRVKNLVVTTGLALMADLLRRDPPTTGLSHMAVGTNNTAPAAGQTALLAEVFRNSITQTSKSNGILTVRFFLGTTQANGSTLVEVGAFTAVGGGIMFARAIYTAISKTISKTVTFIWTFTITAV